MQNKCTFLFSTPSSSIPSLYFSQLLVRLIIQNWYLTKIIDAPLAYKTWFPDYITTYPLPVEPLLPPLQKYLSKNPSSTFSYPWPLFLSLTFCKNFQGLFDLICNFVKLHMLPQKSLHLWGKVNILQRPKVGRIIPQPSALLIHYHLVLRKLLLNHGIWYHNHAITFGCGRKLFLDAETDFEISSKSNLPRKKNWGNYRGIQ